MTNIMANVTQVINNSPQVGSLVGGQLAATEEAVRQGQVNASQRLEDELKKQVLALEKAERVGEFDPEDPRREETRRERKKRLKDERERRQAEARQARKKRLAALEASGPVSHNPFETEQVIDICV